MTRNTRGTESGRAYLDLQNRARRERRSTQELLTLYDAATVTERVVEIAGLPDDDGVPFRTDTATARTIRDDAIYAGTRVVMDAHLATAVVRFRIDVNVGDPVTPGPRSISLPTLRPDSPPIRLLGYPIETVLAEKIATAITLGDANTRVRDYTDIYTLIGRHQLSHGDVRAALLATCAFRGANARPLSESISELAELRGTSFRAYRTSLGPDGEHLPQDFTMIVETVRSFADPLVEPRSSPATWSPEAHGWTSGHA